MAIYTRKIITDRNWVTLPSVATEDGEIKKLGIANLSQSNGVGQADAFPDHQGLDAPDPNILEWSHGETAGRSLFYVPPAGNWMMAQEPLQHAETGTIGPNLELAKTLRSLMPGAPKVYMTMNGQGGTGFSDNNWNVGDALYEEAVARTQAAAADDPEIKWDLIVMFLGPNDASDARTAAQFKADVQATVADFRSRVPSARDAIVLFSTFPDSLYNANPGPGGVGTGTYPQLRAALLELNVAGTRWLENSRCVLTDGLTTHDSLHYKVADYRELGRRTAAAYMEAVREREGKRIPTVALTYDPVRAKVVNSRTGVPVVGGTIVTDKQFGPVLRTDGSQEVAISASLNRREYTKRGMVRFRKNAAGTGTTATGALLGANAQINLISGRTAKQITDGDLGHFLSTRLSGHGASVVLSDMASSNGSVTTDTGPVVGQWATFCATYKATSPTTGVLNVWVNNLQVTTDAAVAPLDDENQILTLGSWGGDAASQANADWHAIEVLPYAISSAQRQRWHDLVMQGGAELVQAHSLLTKTDRSVRFIVGPGTGDTNGRWVKQRQSGRYAVLIAPSTYLAGETFASFALPFDIAATFGKPFGIYYIDINVHENQAAVRCEAYVQVGASAFWPFGTWTTAATRANATSDWEVKDWNQLTAFVNDGGTGKAYDITVNPSTGEVIATQYTT